MWMDFRRCSLGIIGVTFVDAVSKKKECVKGKGMYLVVTGTTRLKL
jgi:hypothetical protein